MNEEKFNINQKIFSKIQDVERETKDLDFVGSELIEETLKLIGTDVDPDNDNPPLNWDSHINPELNEFNNKVRAFINHLDSKRVTINEAYEGIKQLEADREKYE